MDTAYIEHFVSTSFARSYGDKLHPYLETKYQSSSSARTWNREGVVSVRTRTQGFELCLFERESNWGEGQSPPAPSNLNKEGRKPQGKVTPKYTFFQKKVKKQI